MARYSTVTEARGPPAMQPLFAAQDSRSATRRRAEVGCKPASVPETLKRKTQQDDQISEIVDARNRGGNGPAKSGASRVRRLPSLELGPRPADAMSRDRPGPPASTYGRHWVGAGDESITKAPRRSSRLRQPIALAQRLLAS